MVKSGQAIATIGLLVEDDQLRHVKDATSAQEAWKVTGLSPESIIYKSDLFIKEMV